jgi:hypothetical protein
MILLQKIDIKFLANAQAALFQRKKIEIGFYSP